MKPTLNYLSCPDANAGHRMAYWQWGSPDAGHVVVCVHGLARQGRDFDVLAQGLCDAAKDLPGGAATGIRVICPDVVGRGASDWLKDPMGYQLPAYVADMLALLAHLQAQAAIKMLDWVGTSMGGLIGIVLASAGTLPRVSAAGLPPVRKLVLNDVGPAIEWQAIVRIGRYLGQAGEFESVQLAADAMWAISTSFGPHTPAQWLALSRPMLKPLSSAPNSKVRLHYDPAIALPFKQTTEEAAKQGSVMLWQLYDGIKAQTLLLRGADSDLLSTDTAHAMTQRGPRASLVEFAGVGHAPTLVADDQVKTVVDFLLG